MSMIKKLALVVVASAFVVGGLGGCGEKTPGQKAGEQIDKANDKAKELVK
jgi:hypothetical protein